LQFSKIMTCWENKYIWKVINNLLFFSLCTDGGWSGLAYRVQKKTNVVLCAAHCEPVCCTRWVDMTMWQRNWLCGYTSKYFFSSHVIVSENCNKINRLSSTFVTWERNQHREKQNKQRDIDCVLYFYLLFLFFLF
jgi:hypothetical protein